MDAEQLTLPFKEARKPRGFEIERINYQAQIANLQRELTLAREQLATAQVEIERRTYRPTPRPEPAKVELQFDGEFLHAGDRIAMVATKQTDTGINVLDHGGRMAVMLDADGRGVVWQSQVENLFKTVAIKQPVAE